MYSGRNGSQKSGAASLLLRTLFRENSPTPSIQLSKAALEAFFRSILNWQKSSIMTWIEDEDRTAPDGKGEETLTFLLNY